MDEKELIQKLSEFKKIKPNSDWAVWLKAHILETKQPEVFVEKPKVKLAGFEFIHKYQKAFVPAVLSLFFVFSFAFAQSSLPGDVLYPIKTLTQDAKIYFASERTKPIVRLEIVKSRMEDLAKVQDEEAEVSAIAKNITKDLELVPQEIKKIDKKQVALDVSKNIQEKSKDLGAIVEKINLEENNKQELTKTVENTQSQVLALIMETTEEINHCPTYLSNSLVELGEYFANSEAIMSQWSSDEIVKAKSLLVEAGQVLKAGDCLQAMEKIESIKQLLAIHSLDLPTQNSLENLGQVEVENYTPTPNED